MEQFAKELLLHLQKMPEVSKKEKIEPLIRTFFNRRSIGNYALMLGCSDSSIVRDILATTADDLINDNNNYLIRIKRVRPVDEKIIFSFNELDDDLSYEEQECIKELFNFY